MTNTVQSIWDQINWLENNTMPNKISRDIPPSEINNAFQKLRNLIADEMRLDWRDDSLDAHAKEITALRGKLAFYQGLLSFATSALIYHRAEGYHQQAEDALNRIVSDLEKLPSSEFPKDFFPLPEKDDKLSAVFFLRKLALDLASATAIEMAEESWEATLEPETLERFRSITEDLIRWQNQALLSKPVLKRRMWKVRPIAAVSLRPDITIIDGQIQRDQVGALYRRLTGSVISDFNLKIEEIDVSEPF